MPRRRGAHRDGRDHRLEFLVGPLDAGRRALYASRAEHVAVLRAAWEHDRDDFMANFRRQYEAGMRPWAWWRFEAGEDHPGDRQVRRLVELGEMDRAELAAVAEAGAAFVREFPPPYLSVPGRVRDANVARQALGLQPLEVEVLDGGGEG